jgi:hypothetical protein
MADLADYIDFLDGFDGYTSAANGALKWLTFNSNGTGPVATRFGVGRYLRHGTLVPPLKAPRAYIGVMGAWYIGSGYSITLKGDTGNLPHLTINFFSDGSGSVVQGYSGTVLATWAAGSYAVSAWHHFETQAVIDTTAGSVYIWVDGGPTPLLALTGVRTRNTYSGTVTNNAIQVTISTPDTSSYVDDFVLYDPRGFAPVGGQPGRFGDCKILTSVPAGAGTGDVNGANVTQTGGTAGQPYTAINEADPDGNTSYLASGTPGDTKTFVKTALAATPSFVKAVAVDLWVTKDDAASRAIASVLRSGGVNQIGASKGVPSSVTCLQTISATDPNTGGVWGPASGAAVEVGFQVAA